MNQVFESEQKLPSPVFVKYSFEKYRNYQCKHCGLGFKEINDLRNHSITIEKAFTCPMCNFVFSTLKGMKQHYGKLHSKYRPFKCLTCRKKFRNKYALKFHIEQVHEQATRVKCSQCLASFYNLYSLNRHLKICNRRSE